MYRKFSYDDNTWKKISHRNMMYTQLAEDLREFRNRFELLSEERVKEFSSKTVKTWWKLRKLWHLEVSQIFKKHFLTSRYEYANEWVDDVIASHNFPFILYTEMTNISYFSYENVRLAVIPLWCRIMLTPIYLDMRDILSQVWAKY